MQDSQWMTLTWHKNPELGTDGGNVISSHFYDVINENKIASS